MRSARAKVVNGKIVTRAKFPEGAKLVIVVDEPQPTIVLDEEDKKALDEAITAAREGRTIPIEAFRAILRTL